MATNADRQLIISADDFGLRPEATHSILQLAEAGQLDRVSVMSRFLFSKELVERLKKTGVRLDLHLDMIEALQSGTEQNPGVLQRIGHFVQRYATGKLSQKIIRKSWEDQITTFQKLFGSLPDGLNSHEHLHYFPRYFSLILELAEKYRIPYLRFGRRGMCQAGLTTVRTVLATLHKANRKRFAQTTLQTSDYVVSFDWVGNADALVQKLPQGTTELVVHPEKKEELKAVQELRSILAG